MDFDIEILSDEGDLPDPLFHSIMNAMDSMKEATADKIYRRIRKEGNTNYSKPQVDRALASALKYGIFEIKNNQYRVREEVLDDDDTIYWKSRKRREHKSCYNESCLNPESDKLRYRRFDADELLDCPSCGRHKRRRRSGSRRRRRRRRRASGEDDSRRSSSRSPISKKRIEKSNSTTNCTSNKNSDSHKMNSHTSDNNRNHNEHTGHKISTRPVPEKYYPSKFYPRGRTAKLDCGRRKTTSRSNSHFKISKCPKRIIKHEVLKFIDSKVRKKKMHDAQDELKRKPNSRKRNPPRQKYESDSSTCESAKDSSRSEDDTGSSRSSRDRSAYYKHRLHRHHHHHHCDFNHFMDMRDDEMHTQTSNHDVAKSSITLKYDPSNTDSYKSSVSLEKKKDNEEPSTSKNITMKEQMNSSRNPNSSPKKDPQRNLCGKQCGGNGNTSASGNATEGDCRADWLTNNDDPQEGTITQAKNSLTIEPINPLSYKNPEDTSYIS